MGTWIDTIGIKIPPQLKNSFRKLLRNAFILQKRLISTQVNYPIENDIPSIFCEYQISETQNVFFACLRPAPPSPKENDTAKKRDAELMIVGECIRTLNKPVVLCGDMNDVVWPRTARLFKKMTPRTDPRVGRGFFCYQPRRIQTNAFSVRPYVSYQRFIY